MDKFVKPDEEESLAAGRSQGSHRWHQLYVAMDKTLAPGPWTCPMDPQMSHPINGLTLLNPISNESYLKHCYLYTYIAHTCSFSSVGAIKF